jgi:hypothetical protein
MMKQSEVIEMAKEAGLLPCQGIHIGDLKAFAKLVAAKEREACAQVVNDDRGLSDDDAIRVCRAIRARGEE